MHDAHLLTVAGHDDVDLGEAATIKKKHASTGIEGHQQISCSDITATETDDDEEQNEGDNQEGSLLLKPASCSSSMSQIQKELLTAVAYLEPVPISILTYALMVDGRRRCFALGEMKVHLMDACERGWLTTTSLDGTEETEDETDTSCYYQFATSARQLRNRLYKDDDDDDNDNGNGDLMDDKQSSSIRQRHLEYGRRIWSSVDAGSPSPVELIHASSYIVQQYLRHDRSWAASNTATTTSTATTSSATSLPIADANERRSLARLCLLAGQAAAKASQFTPALSYLEFGISLLGITAWDDDDDDDDENHDTTNKNNDDDTNNNNNNNNTYDCILALHNAAMEMLLVKTEYEPMERYIDTVLANARNEPDKLLAKCTRLQAMGASGDQNVAIDYAIEILATLNEKLPQRGRLHQILPRLVIVKRLIGSRSDADLLAMKPMTDPAKLMSMRIINAIFLRTIFVRPSLVALSACKFMELTLRYGMSAMTPNAYACYSVVMALAGDLRNADRFGRLSVALLDQLGIIESLPRVYGAYYGGVFAITNPTLEALPKLLRGYEVGRQTGDLESACMNVSVYCITALGAGVTLTEITAKWNHCQSMMESLKQEALLKFVGPSMRAVFQYINGDNRSEETTMVDARGWEEAVQYFKANKMEPMILYASIPQLYVDYIFDKNLFPQLSACIKSARTSARNDYSAEWICSLCLMKQARSGQIGKRKAMRYARQTLIRLRRLQPFCPINFLDKVFFVEAEMAALKGQVDEALTKYVCSVALAHKAERTHVEAMANERAGRFLLALHRKNDARPYIEAAYQGYHRWAAYAKVKKLAAEFDFLSSDLSS